MIEQFNIILPAILGVLLPLLWLSFNLGWLRINSKVHDPYNVLTPTVLILTLPFIFTVARKSNFFEILNTDSVLLRLLTPLLGVFMGFSLNEYKNLAQTKYTDKSRANEVTAIVENQVIANLRRSEKTLNHLCNRHISHDEAFELIEKNVENIQRGFEDLRKIPGVFGIQKLEILIYQISRLIDFFESCINIESLQCGQSVLDFLSEIIASKVDLYIKLHGIHLEIKNQDKIEALEKVLNKEYRRNYDNKKGRIHRRSQSRTRYLGVPLHQIPIDELIDLDPEEEALLLIQEIFSQNGNLDLP